MTKAELIETLEGIKARAETVDRRDVEGPHQSADQALLDFIGDPEVETAFEAVPKSYSAYSC